MKKFISGFISGAILCGGIALAANYSAIPATFKVFVNGKEFNSDPAALVVDGRTYLPLRAIGDALNIPVNWNDKLGRVEIGTTDVTLDDAVKAILPIAHAEHDTEYWTIDDTYYDILEENSEAYMVTLSFVDNEDAIASLAAVDPDNYIVAMGSSGYAPYYILEKGTGKLLGGGGLQDEWEGMLNDLLYGDGSQGSSKAAVSNQKIDPIEVALAEQKALSQLNQIFVNSPALKTRYLAVNLPTDRTEVTVKLVCGGKVIYEKEYNTSSETADISLKSSGTLVVDIYIDNEFVSSETIDFT